jgi:hypothetical protein
VQIPLETNYLVPNVTFWALLVVMLVVVALLVVWPLVESLASRQWGYVLGILVLGPIGGLVWLTTGRPQTRRSLRAHPSGI